MTIIRYVFSQQHKHILIQKYKFSSSKVLDSDVRLVWWHMKLTKMYRMNTIAALHMLDHQVLSETTKLTQELAVARSKRKPLSVALNGKLKSKE